MINKQRVKRIRGFLYTCILLIIFVPVILMLVVSFKTMGFLSDLSSYLEDQSPAVSQAAPDDASEVSRPGDELSSVQSAENEPGQQSQDQDEMPTDVQTDLAETGRYVQNTYLPASHPELYFDTIPQTEPAPSQTIYLTFDNTPSPQAESILDVLADHGVRGTFFVWRSDPMGDQNAAFYQKLLDGGHQIGIHSGDNSLSYSELYASVDSFLTDFEKAFEAVYSATGVKPRLYRLPGGSVHPYNQPRQDMLIQIKDELDARGFLQYDWSASAQDAVYPPLSKTQILRNIEHTLPEDGRAVILMHDSTGSASTAEALDELIRQYKAAGYSFGVLEYDTEPVSFLHSARS